MFLAPQLRRTAKHRHCTPTFRGTETGVRLRPTYSFHGQRSSWFPHENIAMPLVTQNRIYFSFRKTWKILLFIECPGRILISRGFSLLKARSIAISISSLLSLMMIQNVGISEAAQTWPYASSSFITRKKQVYLSARHTGFLSIQEAYRSVSLAGLVQFR